MPGSLRSMGRRTIQVGLLSIPVTIAKATESQKEYSFTKLCPCHNEPLKQHMVCPSGNHALRSDENPGDPGTFEPLKGVERGDGTYAVLNQLQLDTIAATVKLDTIKVEEFIPRSEAPFSFVRGAYYLRPDTKNVKGSDYPFRLLHAALAKKDAIAIAKWTGRSSQEVVAIHAEGDVLMMNTVAFATQIRQPDADCTDHMNVSVAGTPEFDLACDLIDANMNQKFDLAKYEDEALPLYEEAVQAALGNKSGPAFAQPKAPELNQDILAALRGSFK